MVFAAQVFWGSVANLALVLTHSAGAEGCYGDLCSNQTKEEGLEYIPGATHHGCHRHLIQT